MKRWITSRITLLVLAAPVLTAVVTWEMDPAHSSFQLKVRHLMVSNVMRDFGKSRGVVVTDDKDITKLKVEVAIDAGPLIQVTFSGTNTYEGLTETCPASLALWGG